MTDVKVHVRNLLGMKLGNFQNNLRGLDKKYGKAITESFCYELCNNNCSGKTYTYPNAQGYLAAHASYTNNNGEERYEIADFTAFKKNNAANYNQYNYDANGVATGVSCYRSEGFFEIFDNGNGEIDINDTIKIDGKEKTIKEFLA